MLASVDATTPRKKAIIRSVQMLTFVGSLRTFRASLFAAQIRFISLGLNLFVARLGHDDHSAVGEDDATSGRYTA
jgi:hypothetical protein